MSDRELLHYKVVRKGSPQASHTQRCCMCSRRIFQNEECVLAFCEHSAHYDCALENRKDEPGCPGDDCVSRIAPTPVRVFEEELSAAAVCKVCNKSDTTLSFGCGHWFHNHCVEHESHAWFVAQCFELNSLQNYRNWPCPSCRASVDLSRLVELFPLHRDEIAKHIRGQVLTHINAEYEEDMKKTENTWRRLFLRSANRPDTPLCAARSWGGMNHNTIITSRVRSSLGDDLDEDHEHLRFLQFHYLSGSGNRFSRYVLVCHAYDTIANIGEEWFFLTNLCFGIDIDIIAPFILHNGTVLQWDNTVKEAGLKDDDLLMVHD